MSAVSEKSVSPTEEHGTKFRPSENFIHMKKYLKWKFENSSPTASNDSPQSSTTVSSPSDEEKVKPPRAVQPPLPPYSPPPGIYIKQEVKTTDYGDWEPEPHLDFNQQNSVHNASTTTAQPKQTMCRNFVRGTCNNEHTCKFVHKIIKDQLKMVYTFCKEFQNKGCFLQDCRYVHCTVFEQEEFYRTGKLPAHATEHIKQRQQRSQKTLHPEDQFNISQPPQVVPLQPTVNTFESSPAVVPVVSTPPYVNGTDALHYAQPRPVYQYELASSSSNTRPWDRDNQFHVPPPSQILRPQLVPQLPSSTVVPVGNTPTSTNVTSTVHYVQPRTEYQYELASSASNKRPWEADSVYTQRDFSDMLLKKCENCDKNEYRCEFYKDKSTEMMAEAYEKKQEIKNLDEKAQRLINMLKFLGIPVSQLEGTL